MRVVEERIESLQVVIRDRDTQIKALRKTIAKQGRDNSDLRRRLKNMEQLRCRARGRAKAARADAKRCKQQLDEAMLDVKDDAVIRDLSRPQRAADPMVVPELLRPMSIFFVAAPVIPKVNGAYVMVRDGQPRRVGESVNVFQRIQGQPYPYDYALTVPLPSGSAEFRHDLEYHFSGYLRERGVELDNGDGGRSGKGLWPLLTKLVRIHGRAPWSFSG